MNARSLVLTALALVAFGQSTAIKVILGGKGWSLAGKELKPGQTVPESAEITGGPGESSDLLLDCGPSVGSLAYSCKMAQCQVTACRTNPGNVNVQRVDAVPRESSGSFFLALFRRDPAPVALLASRAAGDISDSVVAQTGDQVHLAPALNRVLEGKYCFRFTPLPETNRSTIQTATMNWDRTSDAEGLLSAPKLRPGLYSVEKSNSDAEGECKFDPDTARAWILITPDSEFPHVSEVWTGFKEKLRAMEDAGASPDVVRTTRHAILAHLADSVEAR
jgi:hypothetical protein